jgi:hypothetical protein
MNCVRKICKVCGSESDNLIQHLRRARDEEHICYFEKQKKRILHLFEDFRNNIELFENVLFPFSKQTIVELWRKEFGDELYKEALEQRKKIRRRENEDRDIEAFEAKKKKYRVLVDQMIESWSAGRALPNLSNRIFRTEEQICRFIVSYSDEENLQRNNRELETLSECPVCREKVQSVGHHVGRCKNREHIEFRRRQEELVLEYYRQKISVSLLLARNDFYFRYDFIREVLAKNFFREEIFVYLREVSHENYVRSNRQNTLKQVEIYKKEPERLKRAQEKRLETRGEYHHSLETRKQMSITAVKRFEDPRELEKIMINNVTHKGVVRGFRKDTNRYARSCWEANVDRIAQFENKKLLGEFEIEPIEIIDDTGKRLTPYHPDRFDIDGLFEKGAYLEVKGWRDENYKKAILAQKVLSQSDRKILIIGNGSWADIQYRDLEAKYRLRIPLWEDNKQNLRTRSDLYKLDVEERVHEQRAKDAK